MLAIKNMKKKSLSFYYLLAAAILVISGLCYHITAAKYQSIIDNHVSLQVPLSDVPIDIDNWKGFDLEIPLTTKEYMEENFADDYLSRRYINNTLKVYADVYVVYCSSRPSGIIGHRPRICYPNHGWIYDESDTYKLILSDSREIPCLIHHFHKPVPHSDEIFVLNFFILNGQITLEEGDFSNMWGRRPNIFGDPARYVGQIQISSGSKTSVIKASEKMVGILLDYFPGQDYDKNHLEDY